MRRFRPIFGPWTVYLTAHWQLGVAHMVAPCCHFRGHAARSCSFGVTESNAPMKPPTRGVHHVSSRDRVRIRDRFAFASVMDSRSPSSRTPNVNRVASEDRRSNPLPGLVTLIGPATIPDRASRARPLLVRWIGWIVGSNNRSLSLRREDCLVGLLVLVGQPSIRATKIAAMVGC